MPWDHGDPVRIIIPGPPQAWQRAGHRIAKAKSGALFVQSYTQTKTRDGQTTIKHFAHTAMAGRTPIDCEVELRFGTYLTPPKSWSRKKTAAALADEIRPTTRPDFDNYSRMIDALKGIVWTDDSRVTDSGIFKRYSDKPRLVIEVRPLVWRSGLME